MIQRDNYALICIDEQGKQTIIYPMEDEDSIGLSVRPIKYCNDYKQVEKYIKKHLGLKYVRIIITKVVECVEPSLVNAYEKEKIDRSLPHASRIVC